MWIAAREGHIEVVKVLIKLFVIYIVMVIRYKANVYAKSGSGTTPLEAAQKYASDLRSDFSSKSAQEQV